MGLITKKTKPKADYHQWQASELNNGDILGIIESLGRAACEITIESLGGSSTIRFNVSKKIYKDHNDLYNPRIGLGQGALHPSPVLQDEIEQEKDNIVIEANAVETWTDTEICVHDIKIVSKSTGLKITVT